MGHARDELAPRRAKSVHRSSISSIPIVDARSDSVEAASDRLLAARDRAAAALDRAAAALDRQLAAQYLRQAYRDGLTGVLQRDAGRERLSAEVDRAHRMHESLVIAFVDVDGLKRVNDEQGHAAGDRILRAAGTALRKGLRRYDVVVRYGGDEFVCALPKISLAAAARRLSEVETLLAAAVEDASVSVGLTELEEEETLDHAVNRADEQLYHRRQQSPRIQRRRDVRHAAAKK
jgi:diguanylate cyclase (GGDEF)-like protein